VAVRFSEAGDPLRGRARADALLCARQPCKRQSPRQERSPANVKSGIRTADGSEAQKSSVKIIPGRPPLQLLFIQQAIGHPDENKSGRTIDANDRWVRTAEMPLLI
jgi:hypothetical protein